MNSDDAGKLQFPGEALYRQMFERSSIGMAQLSLEGKWLHVNERVCQITGYSREELLSMTFADITHPDDINIDWAHAEALAKGETDSYSIDKRYLRRDGSIYWVRLTGNIYRDSSGKPQYFLAYLDDINDKKLLETERARLYELPDHLLCTLDERGEFRTVNSAFTNVLGYKKEEIIGKTIWDFVHPDDRDISIETQQLGATTIISGFENRYRTKTGAYRWLRWSGTIINGINYGAAMDVTELKKAEQLLRVSEQQYKVLHELMLQGVIRRNADGQIVSMNAAAENILGFTLEEFGGKTSKEIVFKKIKEDGSDFPVSELPSTIALIEGRVSQAFMGVFNPRQKAYRWIDVSAVPLFNPGDPKPYLVYSIFDDITERKINEETLRESEERFRTLADNIQNLAWMANPDGWIFWYNKQWYDYTGTTFEEMQGWGWEQVHHPDHRERVVAFAKEAWGKGEPWELTFPLRSANGSFKWFLTRAFAVRDKNGNVIRWIGTNTNIDEQKRAMEQKDAFIGIASHELKTPLTSIKAYMQLLERQLADPVQKGYVAKTNSYISKLQSLVSDLLDVSKIQAGKLQFRFSEFSFETMVDDTIESISHTYKPHAIIKEGSVNGALVYGDRLRLEQALLNFLTNAIKYSPQSDKVLVQLSCKENTIELTVTDYGIGIPDDKQPKIFERFFRVQDNSQQFAGLGIGLYIASEIVKRHHGRVWVKSEEGKGSTFGFSIPVGELVNNQLSIHSLT
jgi:PAS domain S-box-containing protein